MDNKLTEALKGMSREERKVYFAEHKSDFISLGDVSSVNGGIVLGSEDNPNSEECPFNGRWASSFGYVCNGIEQC